MIYIMLNLSDKGFNASESYVVVCDWKTLGVQDMGFFCT